MTCGRFHRTWSGQEHFFATVIAFRVACVIFICPLWLTAVGALHIASIRSLRKLRSRRTTKQAGGIFAEASVQHDATMHSESCLLPHDQNLRTECLVLDLWPDTDAPQALGFQT